MWKSIVDGLYVAGKSLEETMHDFGGRCCFPVHHSFLWLWWIEAFVIITIFSSFHIVKNVSGDFHKVVRELLQDGVFVGVKYLVNFGLCGGDCKGVFGYLGRYLE